MGHEDDLYNDLPEETTSDYIAEIENELKNYKKKYDDSQKLIKELEIDKHRNLKRIYELEKKVEILEKNISSLYRTALAEMGRKQKMLSELQSEIDDLAFRRRGNICDRSTNYNRSRARDHREFYDKYHDEDVNLAYERYAYISNDKQRNYHKKNDYRGHESVEEKHSHFDRNDHRKERISIKRSRKEIPVSGSRNGPEVQHNFSNSYKAFREIPDEHRIDHRRSESSEEKRNSYGKNDHRRNGSHDDKSRTKTERSYEDRYPIKPSDQTAEISSSGSRNYSKVQNGFSNPDITSNKPLQGKPTENLIEKKRSSSDRNDHHKDESNGPKSHTKTVENYEKHSNKQNDRIEMNSYSLKHDPRAQNIPRTSDTTSNNALHERPAENRKEEKRISDNISNNAFHERPAENRKEEKRTSDNISNNALHERPTENRKEERNSSDRSSDHHRNESNGHKPRTKHTKSKEKHPTEPCDRLNPSSAAASKNDPEVRSISQPLQNTTMENLLEEILRPKLKKSCNDAALFSQKNQSHDLKSQTKTNESKEKHSIKPNDRTETTKSLGSNCVENVLTNYDNASNKILQETPTENPLEEILDRRNANVPWEAAIPRMKNQLHDQKSQKTIIENKEIHPMKPQGRAEIPSSSLNHDLKVQNISNSSDNTSNKAVHEKPTESIFEELFGPRNGLRSCEAALFSMKKQSRKLITPLKETPNLLKEKYPQIESNKTTVKIPMINEQRMLSPFKNVGRVEIVSRCADEVEPPKSTDFKVSAAACSVTVSDDVEHGVFLRKSRKRPRIQNIIIAAKKVPVSS